VRRLLHEPLERFEELFAECLEPVEWDDAVFPPGCLPATGSLTFTRPHGGAVLVRTSPCRFETGDFTLGVLLSRGACVFSTPEQLQAFFAGSVARAFGEPENTCELALAAAATGASTDKEAHAHGVPETMARALDTELFERLQLTVQGQEAALRRLAHSAVAHFSKRKPKRPASILLVGPAGTGKTTIVEALPRALGAVGFGEISLFRIDCNELVDRAHVTRLVGVPPGYAGSEREAPLMRALRGRRPLVLLLDEVDRADPSIFDSLLLTLLDRGTLTSATGEDVPTTHALVAMTSNLGAEEIASSLVRTSIHDRWAVERLCRDALVANGLTSAVVGRIQSIAVFDGLEGELGREAALASIRHLADEYGLDVVDVDDAIADVVVDIAADLGCGARALRHAAGWLLSVPLAEAARDGATGEVVVTAGPPLLVRQLSPW